MAPNNTPDSRSDNQTLFNSFVQSLGSSISTWFLFLFSGGVVFAVYYARIGYLPDIELNSALSYLAAASIIGGSLVILLTLLLIVPGFLWVDCFTREPELEGAFCNGDKIKPDNFLLNLALPFFLFALAEHFILSAQRLESVVLSVMFLGETIAAKILWIWNSELPLCNKKQQAKEKEKREEKLRLFFKYFWRYSISVTSVWIAVYILFKLLGLANTSHGNAFWHLIICTLGVVLGNITVAVFFHQKRPGWAYTSAAVFALMLLAATDHFDHVPEKILGKYGFGQTNARLIVNDDGYRVLLAAGYNQTNAQTSTPNVVPNITILCRMGPNYFLEFRNMNNTITKMTLPKSDIISWSVETK